TVGLGGDVMLLQERRLRVAIDPVAHGPELVRVRPGEAMAERDVAVGGDAEQSEAGAARVGLRHALVNLLERVLDVREAMMSVDDDVLYEFGAERPERAQHPISA